jgi:hypothetical protein
MPLTYNQLSSVTQKKFIPRMVDNIFDSMILLKRMKEGESYVSVDGGTSIMVPLNYAKNSSGGWFGPSDTFDTTDVDSISSAEYNWVQMYDTIQITGLDERKNSGDAAILKLIKEKVKIAEMTAQDRLGLGIYNAGTDAKAIVGLRAIVNTASTIGGIAQSSYSWWQAQLDSTTTTLSLSGMAARMSACRVGNDRPTVITTDSTNWDRYHNLLQPQQRFQDAESAKGGFSNLLFQGVPVFDDAQCPSGYMFFLNEKYLSMYHHKDADFKSEPFAKPINQDVKSMKLLWMGALGSSNNRMHGAFSALAA